MIRLAHPYFLYGLVLVPVFIILFVLVLRWKKNALKRFGEFAVVQRLMPDSSTGRPVLKFIILTVAFVFIILALADPQVGSKLVKMQRKGIDVIIALDVSNSMLAEDIKPDRLEKAKLAMSKLVDEMKNDRLGIVVFAGKSYVQLPITTDYQAAKLYISTINTNLVPTQGTAIGSAINLAANSFGESDHSKAIILITDGENHEDDAVKASQDAQSKGIKVYAIGMGSPEGSPIPVYNGSVQVGYKKDRQGNTVITRLDETLLEQIASAGDGIYVREDNASFGLKKIFSNISSLEEKEIESRIFSDYEDRFQYFLGVAVVLIIIERIIIERKGRWAGIFKFPGRT
jgi:Ca-activated chloride channel family protein